MTHSVMVTFDVEVMQARDEPEVPEESPACHAIRQLVLKRKILTTLADFGWNWPRDIGE
jgi:hypothetical protein